MPDERMPKEKSAGVRPMLGLPSPALFLAEGEAALKAKAPRLRAQQRGRVAKGKKGRLGAAWGLLRYLWSHFRQFQADSERNQAARPGDGPHNRGSIPPSASAWRGERKREFNRPVLNMPPEEKKGRG